MRPVGAWADPIEADVNAREIEFVHPTRISEKDCRPGATGAIKMLACFTQFVDGCFSDSLRILPVAPFGSSFRNSTVRGYL